MFPFAVGATVGLFSERPTPESLTAAIARYRPTVVTNVPTMLGKLLDHDDAARAKGEPGLDLSTRPLLALGRRSAPRSAPPSLARALLQRRLRRHRLGRDVPHLRLQPPWRHQAGVARRVVEGYELRILPEDAEGAGATPCAPGEIGVLWVKGDSVSHGYWLDRDKSWKTFHGHWCRTGDLFSVDARGLPLLRRARRRAAQGERALGRAGRGRRVPDAPRGGLARGGHRRRGRRAHEDEGVRRPPRFARGQGRRSSRERAPGVREGEHREAQVPARRRVRQRRAEERSRQGRPQGASCDRKPRALQEKKA